MTANCQKAVVFAFGWSLTTPFWSLAVNFESLQSGHSFELVRSLRKRGEMLVINLHAKPAAKVLPMQNVADEARKRPGASAASK